MNFIVEPAQPGTELVANLGIQRAEGFVQKQDLGPRCRARATATAGAARPRAVTDSARRSPRAVRDQVARRRGP